jgi:hypothetical protein
MYQSTPLFEDRPQLVWWLKLVLGLVLAITLVMGIVLFSFDRLAAVVMFGVTLFDLIIFYCILPRAYQIYPDRFKIVLGRPFAMTIPFKDIEEVFQTFGSNAYASSGIRFATSNKYVVEIARRGKTSVIISPAGGELFVEQVNKARRNHASRRPD